MREIVFDTETTGFDPLNGDRLVEIGCVEIENHMPTGRHYHQYVNPERDVPQSAVRVHGLTADFLSDKPVFSEIVGDFLDFIGESPLVAHNATFDFGFIDMELGRAGFKKLNPLRMVDTLQIAREKFPGSPASLDALCKRFSIDSFNRDLHGALLDSEILAAVYLELRGGRQPDLLMGGDGKDEDKNKKGKLDKFGLMPAPDRAARPARAHQATELELKAHQEFLNNKIKNALWFESN